MIVPENVSSSGCGWFALVSYVPDPPRSHLELLRRALPNSPKPPLHITILPPRPLRLSMEEACGRVGAVADDAPPFTVELSDIAVFPETDFLYVDIGAGKDCIIDIHRRLSLGELGHTESFEFRPHVTLGGPLPKMETATVRETLQAEWLTFRGNRRLHVKELVCLWIPPGREMHGQWERYQSYELRDPTSDRNDPRQILSLR